jgi:hypothetical protein
VATFSPQTKISAAWLQPNTDTDTWYVTPEAWLVSAAFQFGRNPV